MLHITIGINPVIAQLGPFALRWYSLAILMAIGIAAVVTKRELLRKGMPLGDYDTLVFWTVVGGIVGARLFHVVDHLGFYLAHPGQILSLDQGGLAIYGAVAGGFITVLILSYRRHIPFLPLIDAIAPGLLLAQAFGRFGCIVNGDSWGAPTNSPFAFVYTNPNAFLPHTLLGVPTHPYPIYDMALNLLVFAVIWRLRGHNLPAGALFATFVALYAPGRFLISFVRQERIWFWGLQEAQVIALTAMFAAVAMLIWLLSHRHAVMAPFTVASASALATSSGHENG